MHHRIAGWAGALLLLAGCGTPPPSTHRPPPVRPAVSSLPASSTRFSADRPAPTTAITSTARQPSPTSTSIVPTATARPPASATPSPDIASIVHAQHHKVHVVEQGETLAALESRGTQAGSILRYNHQHTDQLRPGQPLIVDAADGPGPALVSVERGNPAQPRVALTFDAGSNSAPTPRLLDVLREHKIHVTFFLTGRWMLENPTLTRRIVADGHEIANHSFSHPDFTKLDDQAISSQLSQTEQIAQQIAGVSTQPYFRFPFGAFNRRTLDRVIDAGYLPIYWTLDSLDSVGKPRTPEFLTERVTGKLSREQLDGAIILMHCGSVPTAEALPAILERFAAMGIQVTTVSEVLGP